MLTDEEWAVILKYQAVVWYIPFSEPVTVEEIQELLSWQTPVAEIATQLEEVVRHGTS